MLTNMEQECWTSERGLVSISCSIVLNNTWGRIKIMESLDQRLQPKRPIALHRIPFAITLQYGRRERAKHRVTIRDVGGSFFLKYICQAPQVPSQRTINICICSASATVILRWKRVGKDCSECRQKTMRECYVVKTILKRNKTLSYGRVVFFNWCIVERWC